MRKYFFYLAVLGFLVSLITHILSITNINIDVQGKFPYVFLLHFGVFVVSIPAILDLMKNKELIEFQKTKKVNPLGFLKIIFAKTPRWLVVSILFVSVYAFFSNIIYFKSFVGNMSELPAKELRFFSGGWLAFYSINAALLYPFRKEEV